MWLADLMTGWVKLQVDVSVAAKKGTKMAAKWSPAMGAVRSQPFPLLRVCGPERPGAVKGALLLGAAKRTLDGEDRSEMIAEEGKAGRKIGEKWSAILVPSPAASNTPSDGARRDRWCMSCARQVIPCL